jgi:hypothetical protein
MFFIIYNYVCSDMQCSQHFIFANSNGRAQSVIKFYSLYYFLFSFLIHTSTDYMMVPTQINKNKTTTDFLARQER